MSEMTHRREIENQGAFAGQREPYEERGARGMQAARVGMDFEGSLTGDMRLALHDFVESATVCEWCADRCLDEGPEMSECVRMCRDVADLASLNVALLSRDSAFGLDVAETFAEAAEACARECSRHEQTHCQECAHVLERAVDSTWRMVESFEESY